MPELIGPAEIARRLGVTPGAVSHWISRSALGSKSPLRPRFPRPFHVTVTGKLWAWEEVVAWGHKWQENHHDALPGLERLAPDEETQEILEEAAELVSPKLTDHPIITIDNAFSTPIHFKIVTEPQTRQPILLICTCPEGSISLTCPVHT